MPLPVSTTHMDYSGMKLEREGIRVSWEDIGEGMNGDYNDKDPDDQPLYRFYVDLNTSHYPDDPEAVTADEDGWFEPVNNSYCTLVNADTTPEDVLQKGLRILWSSVKDKGVDRNLQELSWMDAESIQKREEVTILCSS